MARRSHVHFVGLDNARQESFHEAEITIHRSQTGVYDVNIGFLKFNAVYQVEFEIHDDLPNKHLTYDALQNQYLQLSECKPTAEGHAFVFEMTAAKFPMMAESFKLKAKGTNKEVKLVIHAKVLQKQQGHSSLRAGVVLLKNPDSDGEQTEWQGFDD